MNTTATAALPTSIHAGKPMTGFEYVNNPTACPYCRSADTRDARTATGRACNACNGIWSHVYRGDVLVGYDPHRQHDARPRQTPHPTAPYAVPHVAPVQVPARGPGLSVTAIGDAVADLMRD